MECTFAHFSPLHRPTLYRLLAMPSILRAGSARAVPIPRLAPQVCQEASQRWRGIAGRGCGIVPIQSRLYALRIEADRIPTIGQWGMPFRDYFVIPCSIPAPGCLESFRRIAATRRPWALQP